MLPAAFWLVYAVPAYVLWTLVFPLRYGFWPVAGRFPPRNLYAWVDFILGLTLIGYSAWVVLGPAPDPARVISVPAGICFWAAGVILRWWAVATLGPHWRIGQDESDTRAEFVATGPYRLIHHPINAALILVAIGQALMTGVDAGAIALLAVSVLYFLVQGRAEEASWKKRQSQATEQKDK
jgi:protein-S-isoprenylcysteine O-methyltransferase Ste14